MKTPLVLLNLWHQPLRSMAAIFGISFAVLLIFMQLGFHASAETAANTLYNALDFDLVLLSNNYLNTTRPRGFPRQRLDQALEHADVAAVAPLYIDWQMWRIQSGSHQRRAILVLAFNLDDEVFLRRRVFHTPPAGECLRRLRTPDTVLVDSSTRDYFGPRRAGVETELNTTTIRVVGEFTIGTGYGADGMVLTGERTYVRLTGARALTRPALGLIKLKPEARRRAAEVKEALAHSLFFVNAGGEVQILTRAEIEKRESKYWIQRTSVGVIFQLGLFIALVVGVLFVYQVIATDISERFAEYATLKAIGYESPYLCGVVLRQALLLALFGYVPALLASLWLYSVGRDAAKLPLSMTWPRAAGVLLLTVAMCSLSGLFALRKMRTADPADLF